jgi:hypothetical protein
MEADLAETWRRMRGEDGEKCRQRIGEIREVLKKSCLEPEGGIYRGMLELGKALMR